MSRVHDALRRAEKTGTQNPTAARPEASAPTDRLTQPSSLAQPPNETRAPAVTPPSVQGFRPADLTSGDLSGLLELVEEVPFRIATDSLLIDASRPHEAPMEEFRTLRTRLNHMQSLQPIHTVVVTSASPAEGKSLTASNLALAEAHLTGNTTLLADFDFRRPIVHTLFGIDRGPGITDYLLGKAPLHKVIKKIAGTNLYVMPAGEAVMNPLELLNLGRRSPPRNAPGARDLELKSLDGSFRQPAVVPSSPPATPSARAPHEDATAIPHEYDPLASDEPPLPPRTAQSEPPRSVPVDERGAERSQIDAVTSILQGAGLDPADVTPELAQTFGQIIRVIVSGVMDVLQSRQQIKDEFRMRTTRLRPVENNPLKFSANVDDALHNLLAKRNPAYLGPVTAFEDAFADLRKHQLAMLTGIRVAFEAMLAEFDPDRLQEQFDRQLSKGLVPAKLRYWDLFRERHGEIARDPQASFHRLFGEEFARAYEEQLQQLE